MLFSKLFAIKAVWRIGLRKVSLSMGKSAQGETLGGGTSRSQPSTTQPSEARGKGQIHRACESEHGLALKVLRCCFGFAAGCEAVAMPRRRGHFNILGLCPLVRPLAQQIQKG